MNLDIQEHMANCPTCNSDAKLLLTLKCKWLLGVADIYEQEIAACNNCDFFYNKSCITNCD
jgi:hypothetical protein